MTLPTTSPALLRAFKRREDASRRAERRISAFGEGRCKLKSDDESSRRDRDEPRSCTNAAADRTADGAPAVHRSVDSSDEPPTAHPPPMPPRPASRRRRDGLELDLTESDAASARASAFASDSNSSPEIGRRGSDVYLEISGIPAEVGRGRAVAVAVAGAAAVAAAAAAAAAPAAPAPADTIFKYDNFSEINKVNAGSTTCFWFSNYIAPLHKRLALKLTSVAKVFSFHLPPLLACFGADLGGDRFGHFGLGLSHYTHFTSPIRRYADVVVHRLLLASLEMGSAKIQTPPHQIIPKLEGQGALTTAPRGHDSALPGSLAPSVMEMEAAAVGKEEFEAEERRSRRAGAGDASFATNPDGTRTYNKASSSCVLTRERRAVRVFTSMAQFRKNG